MNQNIEVINKHLWAVKFSYIPFISEIEYKPDGEIPAYQECGRITNDGILILNKDYPGFKFLIDLLSKLMKKRDKHLHKEIKAFQLQKNTSVMDQIYSSGLQVEIERRSKERGR